ncbi:hypothetical protein M2103_000945 [Ereboglobus sp. PH5-5]|uniref:hypothetical protein n=1 Tax=unclassified Ereboglobus TaxID=2626932 RepID=UPI002404EA0A|nr:MULTISPECIES: hypothetical protein [unclassified Ereboglobus]MDF9826541.1 hypothetical protein [Ereboglobus sp. PH5-10]MDF9832731.1 hypothetical protein [Ereboglobus sp. PH5-5]
MALDRKTIKALNACIESHTTHMHKSMHAAAKKAYKEGEFTQDDYQRFLAKYGKFATKLPVAVEKYCKDQTNPDIVLMICDGYIKVLNAEKKLTEKLEHYGWSKHLKAYCNGLDLMAAECEKIRKIVRDAEKNKKSAPPGGKILIDDKKLKKLAETVEKELAKEIKSCVDVAGKSKLDKVDALLPSGYDSISNFILHHRKRHISGYAGKRKVGELKGLPEGLRKFAVELGKWRKGTLLKSKEHLIKAKPLSHEVAYVEELAVTLAKDIDSQIGALTVPLPD